ncbi:MAG: A24 family peptidase [Nitriliruptorales bacterium]|nr:A24 family peptidase [Nitriliruptorales bacterium]
MTVLLAALAGLPAGWIGALAIPPWTVRAPIADGPRPSRRLLAATVATTTVLFALVAWHQEGGWALPGLLALTWGLVVGTVIDLRRRILPDRLTFKLPLLVGIPIVIEAIRTDAMADLRRAAFAAVLLPLGMFLFSEMFRLLRGQSGMGLGDVKLAVSLGLGLGWLGGWELVVFGYASVTASVVVAIGLVASGRAKLASRIPFGPYLAIGTIVVLVAGNPIVDWIAERVAF